MRPKRGNPLPLVGLLALAVLMLLMSQRAVAVALGQIVANAWISTMGAVMSIIGAMFGAG